MRRLTVEFQKCEFTKIEGYSRALEDLKTMEVIAFLNQPCEEITMICRVELDKEVADFENYLKLVNDNVYQIQLLKRESNGAYIVLVKHKLPQIGHKTVLDSVWKEGGYLASQEMLCGKFRMSFVGSVDQIKSTLKALEANKILHKILSISDAKFTPDSPLNVLNEKQRQIIIAAYKLGYYDVPRKIGTRQLSEKLGVSKSALAVHLRKAELSLFAAIMNEF